MVDPPSLPTETFYKSVRTYRNLRAFTLLAIILVSAVPLVCGVINHLAGRRTGGLPTLLLYLSAALFLFLGCNLISNIALNTQEPIEIDSKGIRWKHNFWYWTQVKSLAPQKVNFETKYFIRVGLQVDPRVCLLQPDEALTPRQYIEVVERLKPFFDSRYPTIQLKALLR
jgi:hypothetical protein